MTGDDPEIAAPDGGLSSASADNVVQMPTERERTERLFRIEVERLAQLDSAALEFQLETLAKDHKEKFGAVNMRRAVNKRLEEIKKKEQQAYAADRTKAKGLAAIIKLPKDLREAELKKLAKQLGIDQDEVALNKLRAEFDQLLLEKSFRLKSGIVELWDQPVTTLELLTDGDALRAKYVLIHDQVAAPIVPLYAAFTYIYDLAVFSPILVFEGGDAGIGKSNASDTLSRLCKNGMMIVQPTKASIYWLIDQFSPTLCFDEADKLLANPDIATIIRSSWKRDIKIPRVINGHLYMFNGFGPRSLNGIDVMGHLPDRATRTRCITIKMLPLLESEKDSVTSMRYADDDENFAIWRRKAARWANDHREVLKAAQPVMPSGFFSRLAENFHFLFAVADLAGGDWPQRARAAARKVSQEQDEPSPQRRLLEVFYNLGQQGPLLISDELERSVPADDDFFSYYRGPDGKGVGHSINKWEIATLIKKFDRELRPKLIHPRGETVRGYDVSDPRFATLFKHYLGKDPIEPRPPIPAAPRTPTPRTPSNPRPKPRKRTKARKTPRGGRSVVRKRRTKRR
jgi:hypothetical protein